MDGAAFVGAPLAPKAGVVDGVAADDPNPPNDGAAGAAGVDVGAGADPPKDGAVDVPVAAGG